ncbi:hypothetical protein GCM10022221_36380 [Actinocorallia aurea]
MTGWRVAAGGSRRASPGGSTRPGWHGGWHGGWLGGWLGEGRLAEEIALLLSETFACLPVQSAGVTGRGRGGCGDAVRGPIEIEVTEGGRGATDPSRNPSGGMPTTMPRAAGGWNR